MSLTTFAILEGFRSVQDGTLKITLALNEQSAENSVKVLKMLNKSIVVVLSEGDLSKEVVQQAELVKIEKPLVNGKSQSKRLRDVLYRVWETTPNHFDNSEQHYEYMMNNIIEYYKSKIQQAI